MSKSLRLLDIWIYLFQNKECKTSELSEIFEVSQRTIQRDIELLKDLGLNINSLFGKDGGYQLDEKVLLPWQTLSNLEKEVIISAIELLRKLNANYENINLDLFKEKLINIFNIKHLNNIVNLKLPIIKNRFLSNIIEAIKNKSILKIVYESFEKNKLKFLLPLEYFFNNNHWYVYCYDFQKKVIGIYRVDRILSLKKDSKIITTEEYLNIKQEFNKILSKKDASEEVEIITDKKTYRYMNEKQFYNLIVENNNDLVKIKFKIYKHESEFIMSSLLKYGTSIKIIAPKWFKESYLKKIIEIKEKYEK